MQGRKTGGRKRGAPNKVTKALKETILGALEAVGGQTYLAKQATENPIAFMSLLGKVLPSDIRTEHTGPDGKPLAVPTLGDFYQTVGIAKVQKEQWSVLQSDVD